MIFMSLFGMIGLYNLMLYFVIRNRIYLLYCMLVVGFTSHVSLYLFTGDYYRLGSSLSVITAAFTVFSSLLFSRSFLKISAIEHPVLNKTFQVTIWLISAIIILQALNMAAGVNLRFEGIISNVAACLALISILLELSSAIILWSKQNEARLFLATNLPVFLGAAIYTIRWFMLSDTNPATSEGIDLTVYIMFGTVLLQMILFSVVIGSSLKTLEHEKYALQKNYMQQLEQEVADKTLTLQQAKDQIESVNEQLRQSSKFKNKLFSLIAHDLRAPLTSLLGFVQIVEDEEMTKQEIADFLHFQKEKIDDGIRILNRVLKWSYAQLDQVKVQKEETDLVNIVQEAISVYSSLIDSKAIRISLDMQEKQAFADTEMIATVLRNLLSNAVKFSHHKGLVSIRTELMANRVVLSIQDEGIGMPLDQLGQLNGDEKIFRQEGPEGEKGQGFGLIISKDFVEMNDGKLTCESQPGRGTTFFVELDRKKQVDE